MAFELYIIKSNDRSSLCYKRDGEYFDISNPMLSFIEGEDRFRIIEPDKSYQMKVYTYRGIKVNIRPALYCDNNWPAIFASMPKTHVDLLA